VVARAAAAAAASKARDVSQGRRRGRGGCGTGRRGKGSTLGGLLGEGRGERKKEPGRGGGREEVGEPGPACTRKKEQIRNETGETAGRERAKYVEGEVSGSGS
jgi:hypothetical protein